MKKIIGFLLLVFCCSVHASIPAWTSGHNTEANLAGQLIWSAEGSPKGRLQDVGDQTTYATLGGGTVQKKDGTSHDIASANSDLNTTQEITLDQQTGGLDATVTVDHRWASSEGRNNIENNFVDTYEHGQDIGRTVSAVANEDGLGILNFGEALDKNAKGTQLKNDLLRNSENAHILAGLQSEDAEQYAQAMQALGQLAQNKFGLELSDINLYDASKTDSLSLADTALVNVKGGTVVDQNNQEYGNIFIDAGDGASKTDMTHTLGHEVIETQALQGKNGGLTNGLLGTNSAETKETMANLFGAQLADRMNQAAGGELNSSGGANFSSNLQNSQAVVAGTQRADNVGTAEVEYRQFKHIESRMLDQARDQIKNDPTLTVSEKKDKIEQLEAVACASIQCGAGVPAKDSKHNEIAGIQQLGEQLIQEGANLYAMLHELGVDTPTTNNGRMQRKTETSFGYSGQDALTDALTRNLTPAVDGINTAADAALTLVTAGAVGPVVDAANAINGNPSGEGFTAYLAEQAGEGFKTAWEMPSHVGTAVLNSYSAATWEEPNYFGDAALAALEVTGVGKLSSDALKGAGSLLRGADDVAGPAATQARREGGVAGPEAHTSTQTTSNSTQPWKYDNRVDVSQRTAADVNVDHAAKGNSPPYMSGTQVTEYTTKQDDVFVRVHNIDNPNRPWMMRKEAIEGLTADQIQRKYSLPSKPSYVSEVHVPSGTRMRTGKVETNFEIQGGGGQGATQYEWLSVVRPEISRHLLW